jgi:hypothetical protein
MPRSMISESIRGSMLPPPSTRHTLRPRKRSGCRRSAASGAAPAPSATVFSISSSITIDCSTSPSSTSTISATLRATISRVILPGSFTAIPSAMVDAANSGSVPRIAWYIDGKRCTSTPTTSTEGLSALAAVLMPEMSRRPPIATTIMSRSGHSARSRGRRCPPRHDQRIVVGMDEGEVAPCALGHRVGLGAVEVLALEDHLGAEALGLLDLHERRVPRHHDRRGNAEPRGVVRHPLRVVAREQAITPFSLRRARAT